MDKFKKSSSPEPLGQFQLNLVSTYHPGMKGIQVLLNEGPHLFQREDDSEIVKIH